MEADQYQKIKEIFQSVLEAPADERHKLLEERCDSDQAIRAEVERLLDSYESGFLEQPAAGELAASLASNGLRSGAAIGHYKILNKIGAGGMGEVYLAEDGKLGRKVAIKLLPETFTEDADR